MTTGVLIIAVVGVVGSMVSAGRTVEEWKVKETFWEV